MNSDMLRGDHQHSYISISVKHSHMSITLRKVTHAGYTCFLNNHTVVFLFVVLGLSIFIFTLLLYFNKLMMKVLRIIVMQTGYHTADPAVFLSGGSTSSLCLKLSRPFYFPLFPLTLQLSPTKSWTSLSLVLLQISSF